MSGIDWQGVAQVGSVIGVGILASRWFRLVDRIDASGFGRPPEPTTDEPSFRHVRILQDGDG